MLITLDQDRLAFSAKQDGTSRSGKDVGGDEQIRLVDPDGREIDEATWFRTFADPRTRWTLRTQVGPGREVITSWYGVARTEGDPFFQSVLRFAMPDLGRSRTRAVIVTLAGYASRGEAEAGHAAWVAAAERGPLPRERERMRQIAENV